MQITSFAVTFFSYCRYLRSNCTNRCPPVSTFFLTFMSHAVLKGNDEVSKLNSLNDVSSFFSLPSKLQLISQVDHAVATTDKS